MVQLLLEGGADACLGAGACMAMYRTILISTDTDI